MGSTTRAMNRSVAVLPEGLTLESTPSSRFLRLPHPRTGAPALYLPATKGKHSPTVDTDGAPEGHGEVDLLLEVQAINATGDRKRTWFIGDDTVVGDGKMLLLTPFDPVFLLVRILLVVGQKTMGSNGKNARRSLPYDDIFESASQSMSFSATASGSVDGHATRAKRMRMDDEDDKSNDADAKDSQDALLAEDMQLFSRLPIVKASLEKICQKQEIAPDLAAYRLDDLLLLEVLKDKVSRLSTSEAFAALPTLSRLLAKEGVGDGEGIAPDVQREARTKASLDLLAGLLPSEVSKELRACYTFPSLAQYLADTSSSSVLSVDYMPGVGGSTPPLSATSSATSVTSLASSSASSTFGMTRKNSNGAVGKPGSGGADAAKKKPIESNGVKQLKKASTRGMSPLTSFFVKKTPTPSPNSETAPS